MTFKELQRIITKTTVSIHDNELSPSEQQKRRLWNNLKGKPLWIWNPDIHRVQDKLHLGMCCATHILGNPIDKHGIPKPMFDYEEDIFNLLEGIKSRNNPEGKRVQFLYIKKATGIGATSFLLYYCIWKCCYDDSMKGKRICLVVGPNVRLAKTLIKRLREILTQRNEAIQFKENEYVVIINNCIIEIFPSHIDAMRGLTNVKLVIADEADFFPVGQQQNVRHVSERYALKSGATVILVSTPNLPGGLFESIELEDPKTCIYHRMFLDWRVGLHKVFSPEEIQQYLPQNVS